MRFHALTLIGASTLLLVSACRHAEDDGDGKTGHMRLSRPAGAGGATMQPGDIRIVSVDGGVDLALLGDTISSGLSESTIDKVKRETDTGAVTGSGFGASIEKMVKSTVQSAIGTRVAFPLSDVKDVRNDNGKLVFDWTGKQRDLFSHSNVNGRKVLDSFSSADAQRFVDAVHARKRASLQQ